MMQGDLPEIEEELAIEKIQLVVTAHQLLDMPRRFRVLDIACERGEPFIWVMWSKLHADRSPQLVELVFANEPAPVRKEHQLIYVGSFVLPHSDQRVFVFLHEYHPPMPHFVGYAGKLDNPGNVT